MAVHGKNINLFLMDGTANGRVKCTLANWTGIAYRIPRIDLDLCKERQDLKQSGIYFLFGVTDDTNEHVVYVGQAGARKNGEGILTRLQEHKRNPDKDYWSEAVVFTTSNNSFGPTEISYLENRFCAMANEAHRYVVKNGNEPTQGNVTEEKESELEEFIEHAKTLMGVLGHRVFESLTLKKSHESTDQSNDTEERTVLFIKKRAVHACGFLRDDGFVVAEGSTVSTIIAPSCPNNAKNERLRCKDDIDEEGVLRKAILFKSPSAAASFVLGYSASGNQEWKTEDGTTLGALERQ